MTTTMIIMTTKKMIAMIVMTIVMMVMIIVKKNSGFNILLVSGTFPLILSSFLQILSPLRSSGGKGSPSELGLALWD